MKKIFYIHIISAVLVLGLFTSGCKKTSSPSGLVAGYSTITSSNGVVTNYDTVTYTYDAQGRITEQLQTNTTPITYSYGAGTVTQTQGSTVTIYQLNSQGYAVTDNVGDVVTYDSSGYEVTITNTTQGISETSTISNGNIVNMQVTESGKTVTYAYTFLTTPEYRSFGQSFLGKVNVDLINTFTFTNPPNTTTSTLSYVFDSEGRVQTQTSVSGTTTTVATYTYVH